MRFGAAAYFAALQGLIAHTLVERLCHDIVCSLLERGEQLLSGLS